MDDNSTRRRSRIVALTLVGLPVGAIALATSFPGQEMKRNLYPDRATCLQDYGPAQCQQGIGSGAGYASSSWHGPYYYADRSAAAAKSDPGPGRMGRSTATQVSVRGGFGHFGQAHAGG